jgi:ornithine carbamoyltransferase
VRTLTFILRGLPRHFVTGEELTGDEIRAVVDRAAELKADPLSSRVLEGRSVALVFEKPSTRTRLSMEAGVFELGGHPIVLRAGELQVSRGESLRDTALVLGRHVAAIGIRTASDDDVAALAQHSEVPVINLLTADHHPIQVLADLLTLKESFRGLDGLKLAYVGDGNNVARSLAIVGARAGVEVAIASPREFSLGDADLPATRTDDPAEAVAGAHAVYADVWVSMSDDEATADARRAALGPYRVDDALLDGAADGAIALHCLPAHPGEEITAEVLYGPRQRIWDQAENRRHASKALLEHLLMGENDR